MRGKHTDSHADCANSVDDSHDASADGCKLLVSVRVCVIDWTNPGRHS